MPGNKTSNYSITLSKNDFDRKSNNFLGKLRSNFVGTKFTLFDDGNNPKKVKMFEQMRKELCQIEFVLLLGEEFVWNERSEKVSYNYSECV